jgi:hypothetical protein
MLIELDFYNIVLPLTMMITFKIYMIWAYVGDIGQKGKKIN